jgi:hypothetical protein
MAEWQRTSLSLPVFSGEKLGERKGRQRMRKAKKKVTERRSKPLSVNWKKEEDFLRQNRVKCRQVVKNAGFCGNGKFTKVPTRWRDIMNDKKNKTSYTRSDVTRVGTEKEKQVQAILLCSHWSCRTPSAVRFADQPLQRKCRSVLPSGRISMRNCSLLRRRPWT